MKIQSVEKVGDLTKRGSGGYFQAVPLFMRDDVDAFDYFTNFIDEIHETTGAEIVIVLTKQVEFGEAGAIARIFIEGAEERKRFPDLSRVDLPCLWIEDAQGGAAILPIANGRDALKQQIRALADEASKAMSAEDLRDRVEDIVDADQGRRNILVKTFRRAVRMMGVSNERIAIVSGAVFLATMLAIALFVANPSPFQYFVFRSVLSVAAAAFASSIPGILKVKLGTGIIAGGALAVLVIVYMLNPAALVVK